MAEAHFMCPVQKQVRSISQDCSNAKRLKRLIFNRLSLRGLADMYVDLDVATSLTCQSILCLPTIYFRNKTRIPYRPVF